MKTLIYDAVIITQNKGREVIPRGFMTIEDNYITAIGRGSFKEDAEHYDRILDCSGKVVIPGLINAHVHLGESIFQGLLPRKKITIEEYLSFTESLIQKYPCIEEQRKIIADYSMLKLLQFGSTTICGGRTRETAEQWDVRNVSGYMIMNSQKLEKYFRDIEKGFDSEMNCSNGRLTKIGMFAHSLNYVTKDSLSLIHRIRENVSNVPFFIHVAETKKQEVEVTTKFGKSSIEVLNDAGLLGEQTMVIHGNWLSESDLNLLKSSGTSVTCCLSSNLNVADKTPDLLGMLKNGINVCISTDGVATAGTFNLLSETAKALQLYGSDNINFSAQIALDMITINAAKALGLEKRIGSIEEGKLADLTFIEMSRDNLPHEFIEKIVSNDKNASTFGIMIDGNIKMWDKRMIDIDEESVIDKFSSLRNRIQEGGHENSIG